MHEQLYHPIIYFEIFHGGWKHCGQYFHKMAQDCSIINQVNRNVKLCWFMHSNFQVAYVAKLIVDSFSSSLNINTTWRWWLQFPPDDVTTIKFNARTIVIQTDVESATFRRRNMHSLKTPPCLTLKFFKEPSPIWCTPPDVFPSTDVFSPSSVSFFMSENLILPNIIHFDPGRMGNCIK